MIVSQISMNQYPTRAAVDTLTLEAQPHICTHRDTASIQLLSGKPDNGNVWSYLTMSSKLFLSMMQLFEMMEHEHFQIAHTYLAV